MNRRIDRAASQLSPAGANDASADRPRLGFRDAATLAMILLLAALGQRGVGWLLPGWGESLDTSLLPPRTWAILALAAVAVGFFAQAKRLRQQLNSLPTPTMHPARCEPASLAAVEDAPSPSRLALRRAL